MHLANKSTVNAQITEATDEYNKARLVEKHVEKEYTRYALVLWWETGENSVVLSSSIPEKPFLKTLPL
jgi:hypothetical protein